MPYRGIKNPQHNVPSTENSQSSDEIRTSQPDKI